MEVFDTVIIGAGSAGCVLAGRLGEDKRKNILLLEAGGPDRSPWVHLPIGYGKTFYHRGLNWMYETVPEPGLNNRIGYWPRGKVVGGSGAINAMVYAHGLPNDFDDWATAGAEGWGWDSVSDIYQAMETQIAPNGQKTGNGPMTVQDVSDQRHPSNRYFFDAADELGIPQRDDYNQPPFVGASTYRINTLGGRRNASSRAFLKPALRRGNITLRTHALVDRLDFRDGRAVSLSYSWRGKTHHVAANAEIILAAGAVASPAILERSGIGDGKRLAQHGIASVVDNPNVGAHLQDHIGVNYYFKATQPTLNNILHSWPGRIRAALRYALTRRGPLALSVNQCGGYFRSDPALPWPDQQLYFNPVTYTTTPSGTRTIINTDPFPGFIIGFNPARPTSRGHIHLRSADAAAAPVITPNYLTTQEDCQSIIAGAKLCRDFAMTDSLKTLIDQPFVSDITCMSEDEMLEDFRDRSGTIFHPVGTCRMGRDAKTAVVDNHLRVFGIDGLRVVDASVFPNITSANTNAPTMMLAWRAADLISKENR
jgi:choline dehydrogenase